MNSTRLFNYVPNGTTLATPSVTSYILPAAPSLLFYKLPDNPQLQINIPNQPPRFIPLNINTGPAVKWTPPNIPITKPEPRRILVNKRTPVIGRYINPFDYKEFHHMKLTRPDTLVQKEYCFSEKPVTWLCMICLEEKQDKDTLIEHYEYHKQQRDNLIDNNPQTVDNCEVKCPVCSKVYEDLSSYESHVLCVHKPKDHYCSICNRNFNNAFALSKHNREHAPNKDSFTCSICKHFRTTSYSDLDQHITQQHERKVFPCKECRKNFTSKSWFKEHKIFHLKTDVLSCKECKLNFRTKRCLTAHMMKKHKINTPVLDKFECEQCGWTLPFKENLRKHRLLFHDNSNFLCNFCGKTFKRHNLLKGHMVLHKDKKEFVCITCGKSFHKRQVLVQHILTHTGKKPHKCHICEKSFSQRTPLVIHIRTHTGERPYSCPICGKGFVAKTPRDSHQKICNKKK